MSCESQWGPGVYVFGFVRREMCECANLAQGSIPPSLSLSPSPRLSAELSLLSAALAHKTEPCREKKKVSQHFWKVISLPFPVCKKLLFSTVSYTYLGKKKTESEIAAGLQ